MENLNRESLILKPEDNYITALKKQQLANKLEYMQKRHWTEEQYEEYMGIINRYVENKKINRETLEELKKYFHLSTDYWCFVQDVNCYAYALGIDLPPRCFNIMAYNVGYIYEAVNQTPIKHNNSNIIERLEMDLDTLGYSYRVVTPDEEIEEDERKIAFYNALFFPGDYHFLRQGNDGTWYHKLGGESMRVVSYEGKDGKSELTHVPAGIPSNKDSNNNIITDPRVAFFTDPILEGGKLYEFDRCYSLKYKK